MKLFNKQKLSNFSSKIMIGIGNKKTPSIKDILPSDLLVKENDNKVRIRLLDSQFVDFKSIIDNYLNQTDCDNNKVSLKNKIRHIFKAKLANLTQTQRNRYKKIIIQIHGGAFMASTSSYHQTYLRKITNSLEIPLFAIDYRLAPKHKFPIGIHDCVSAFLWIFEFVKTIFEVEVEEYVLLGDSSGGNYVLCLTYWLIESQHKLPKLLLPAYPCIKMRGRNDFTPAALESIDNLFLNQGILELIIGFYLQDISLYKTDPYIDLMQMSNQIIKKMPKTIMYCGDEDILYEDNVRYLEILIRNRVDCFLKVFKYLQHGLLNQVNGTWYSAEAFFWEICHDINIYLDLGKDLTKHFSPKTQYQYQYQDMG